MNNFELFVIAFMVVGTGIMVGLYLTSLQYKRKYIRSRKKYEEEFGEPFQELK